MDEIINYKLKDFLEQDEDLILEYSNILKLIEPTPTKHQLHEMTLREVESIKVIINDPEHLPEVFNYFQGDDKIENIKIVEFYGIINSITNQLENLLRMETRELVSEHTDFKWEAVDGSQRISKLGILPMIDNLALGNILKYEEILNLPYMTVFNNLRMKRILKDIQHDMDKIKTKLD